MEANAPESYFAAYKRRVVSPASLAAIGISTALSIAGVAGFHTFFIKPRRAIIATRYNSHVALMRLYKLQLSYHAAHGTFASTLETLLSSTPDGAQLREQLKATTDITTLAVIGDASRFRLEANILDPERTLVKFRGSAARR